MAHGRTYGGDIEVSLRRGDTGVGKHGALCLRPSVGMQIGSHPLVSLKLAANFAHAPEGAGADTAGYGFKFWIVRLSRVGG